MPSATVIVVSIDLLRVMGLWSMVVSHFQPPPGVVD